MNNKKLPKILVQRGGIHGTCVFAGEDIKRGTEIIQYVGELINKDEAERRLIEIDNKAKKLGKQATYYVFELNKKWDIDGDVDYNEAKYINHSCEPNCEVEIVDDEEIWIIALKEIKRGEELTYDYSFGFDDEEYIDSPCRCGSENCCGYIVAKEEREKLNKFLERKIK